LFRWILIVILLLNAGPGVAVLIGHGRPAKLSTGLRAPAVPLKVAATAPGDDTDDDREVPAMDATPRLAGAVEETLADGSAIRCAGGLQTESESNGVLGRGCQSNC
jgi:hypothetical protein